MMGSPKPFGGFPSRTDYVVAALAEGKSQREIASELGVTTSTVSGLLVSKQRDRSRPAKERSGCRLLNSDQLAEMCELRERGKGIHAIAEHFNKQGIPVTASTIDYQCMRLGADAPPRLRGKTPSRLPSYVRKSGPVRPYSVDDDRLLLELSKAGTRHVDICKALGRSTSSVRGRLLTLARREARREDEA